MIIKRTIRQLDVLTIGSEGDEALPVFSFEEEAEMYLRFAAGAASEDWSVRETSVGELTSVLYGQCASVGQVALDPLPQVCGGALAGLCGVHREEFVRRLMGEVNSTSVLRRLRRQDRPAEC